MKINSVPQGNDYIQSVARCLQMLLRHDEYRKAFIAVDGLTTMLSILSARQNFQIQYQLVFCLWVLTFNPEMAGRMNRFVLWLLSIGFGLNFNISCRFNVIPILADILSDSVKDKVTRIILAVYRVSH